MGLYCPDIDDASDLVDPEAPQDEDELELDEEDQDPPLTPEVEEAELHVPLCCE